MGKKIEEQYKKLTDEEHVLHRPSMYIGSIKPHTSVKWVMEDGVMVRKELEFNPGFMKIFDEIITNSVDESKREGSKLNTIKVSIKNNRITIFDNGGIPVLKHKEHDEWVPEMIFSNMKSGSNFDDSEDRTGAGTNGVGSVCTNIFSKEFILSTCDGKNKFSQTFSDNMTKRTNAKITKSTKKHTEITFLPDYERFGIDGIDDAHYKMIEKRIYDLAGCNPSLKIYFNDILIDINSFEDYIKLYTSEYFYESNKSKTWSVGIGVSEGGFQQISFANSTDTYDGGTHVDYIMNQIVVQMREFFLKKHKVDVKPSEIKSHITLFLDTTIINSSFSSQTKEKLITEVRDFGSTFEISNKLIQSILKSEIVSSILDWIDQKKKAEESKLARELNKTVSNLKVDKLIDAKGRNRWNCSLGLFEGDCLGEDTEIRILRDGDLIDVSIKSVHIGDMVVTHENRFREVTALTKKIEYKNTIKTSLGDIISSNKHRLLVYDTFKNEFYFEKVSNINKTIHKLVKNQLCFMNELLEIDSIDNGTMVMKSGDSFDVSVDHSMCVYNKSLGKFKMVEFGKLNTTDYLLVNTFGL